MILIYKYYKELKRQTGFDPTLMSCCMWMCLGANKPTDISALGTSIGRNPDTRELLYVNESWVHENLKLWVDVHVFPEN